MDERSANVKLILLDLVRSIRQHKTNLSEIKNGWFKDSLTAANNEKKNTEEIKEIMEQIQVTILRDLNDIQDDITNATLALEPVVPGIALNVRLNLEKDAQRW